MFLLNVNGGESIITRLIITCGLCKWNFKAECDQTRALYVCALICIPLCISINNQGISCKFKQRFIHVHTVYVALLRSLLWACWSNFVADIKPKIGYHAGNLLCRFSTKQNCRKSLQQQQTKIDLATAFKPSGCSIYSLWPRRTNFSGGYCENICEKIPPPLSRTYVRLTKSIFCKGLF